jgi:hypothetical protein
MHHKNKDMESRTDLRTAFKNEKGYSYKSNDTTRQVYQEWLEEQILQLQQEVMRLKKSKELLTDDCDINQNTLEVFTGGNGDYYIAIKANDMSYAVRIAMSGGNASTDVKLAVANLYRAMNGIKIEQSVTGCNQVKSTHIDWDGYEREYNKFVEEIPQFGQIPSQIHWLKHHSKFQPSSNQGQPEGKLICGCWCHNYVADPQTGEQVFVPSYQKETE